MEPPICRRGGHRGRRPPNEGPFNSRVPWRRVNGVAIGRRRSDTSQRLHKLKRSIDLAEMMAWPSLPSGSTNWPPRPPSRSEGHLQMTLTGQGGAAQIGTRGRRTLGHFPPAVLHRPGLFACGCYVVIDEVLAEAEGGRKARGPRAID